MMRVDRFSGLFFLLLGLGLMFLIIPTQVETGDDTSLSPEVLPNVVAVVMAICGGILVLRPTEHQPYGHHQIFRAAVITGILFLAVLAVSWFNFIAVAPILALIIMIITGERSPVWLVSGAVLVPTVIWVLITQFLERALP